MERKYECGYCGNKFERTVGKASGAGPPGGPQAGGKIRHVSSQVVCHNCGNFLKTWEN